MFKEPRQYPLCEFVWLPNDETVADVIPADNVIQGGILNYKWQKPYINYIISLYQKGWYADQCSCGYLWLLNLLSLRFLRQDHGPLCRA